VAGEGESAISGGGEASSLWSHTRYALFEFWYAAKPQPPCVPCVPKEPVWRAALSSLLSPHYGAVRLCVAVIYAFRQRQVTATPRYAHSSLLLRWYSRRSTPTPAGAVSHPLSSKEAV